MKEYVGYIIALTALVFQLFYNELIMRLDWVNHGTEYQQLQQRIVQAVQDLDKSLQAVRQDVDRMKGDVTGPEKKK